MEYIGMTKKEMDFLLDLFEYIDDHATWVYREFNFGRDDILKLSNKIYDKTEDARKVNKEEIKLGKQQRGFNPIIIPINSKRC